MQSLSAQALHLYGIPDHVVKQSPISIPMITANTPQNLIPIVLAIDCSIPTTAEELWMIPVTNTPEKKP